MTSNDSFLIHDLFQICTDTHVIIFAYFHLLSAMMDILIWACFCKRFLYQSIFFIHIQYILCCYQWSSFKNNRLATCANTMLLLNISIQTMETHISEHDDTHCTCYAFRSYIVANGYSSNELMNYKK